VIDRVGDRSRHPGDGEFPDTLCSESRHRIGFSHKQHVHIPHICVHRHNVFGQRRSHQAAGTVRDGFLQERHADSHRDAADDLTAGRLRVEDPAAIDGRHYSGDSDRSEVWIDVYKDPVTDKGKQSKRGRMTLLRHRELGTFQTVPVPPEAKSLADVVTPLGYVDAMVTVRENGHLVHDWTFVEVRSRADATRL
jgi:hypothetical protein